MAACLAIKEAHKENVTEKIFCVDQITYLICIFCIFNVVQMKKAFDAVELGD